jgi:hypothetical protein
MTMKRLTGWGILGRLAPVFAVLVFLGCSKTGTSGEPMPGSQEPAAPPAGEMVEVKSDLPDIPAGEWDNGKMWTFEYAPLDYFAEEYGFSPDEAWFEKARLSALRLPNCTASFVSPNGLVMTNHHCARGSVAQVSQPGENLLDNGFYASTLEDERPAQTYVDQMIDIVDVSDEVLAAIATATSDAERAQVQERTVAEISERIAGEYADDGVHVEITSLWNDARFSAYVFKRYSNIRLVMAPELQIGYFGGDPDNFTYPRYNLDVSFYRVYDDDGEPLKPDNYFKWSESGVSDGDGVFVIGNPGSTTRLNTVAQLQFRHAVQEKVVYEFINSRADVLQAVYDENPEENQAIRNQIFGLRNAEKLYGGRYEGLGNPEYMARRADTERQFVEAIDSDPELTAKYGELIDRMAEIQGEKLELGGDYGAFIALGSPAYTSATMRRALTAYRYWDAQAQGAPAAEQLKGQLLSIPDQSPSLQLGMLTARLTDFQNYLGPDSEVGKQVLQGRTPEAAAEAILAHSVLASSESTSGAVDAGALTMEDPAVVVVATIMDRFTNYQQHWQALNQQQAVVAAEIGRAHYDVYGTKYPPDATFSLRMADGFVTGCDYNGTWAPVYTTFFGLYDRHYSHKSADWDLPERWLEPPASFDMATPLNFVMTSDIIGGNSGSPVINTELEVVGLVFDGNIESLPGNYIFDTKVNRAVAVDVRGILEALDDIYDADRIAMELTTGQLFETEAEADAAGGN